MKSTLDVATQKRTASETERDEKKDWIVKGLAQIIPMIPSRQQTMEVTDIRSAVIPVSYCVSFVIIYFTGCRRGHGRQDEG